MIVIVIVMIEFFFVSSQLLDNSPKGLFFVILWKVLTKGRVGSLIFSFVIENTHGH